MFWNSLCVRQVIFAVAVCCVPSNFAGAGNTPPIATDDLVVVDKGEIVMHQFLATDAEDESASLTWSNLVLGSSPELPPIASTLTASGMFEWDTTGSLVGEYTWMATVTDTGGFSDTATLVTLVVPEPASVLLIGGALVFFCIQRRVVSARDA